MVFSTLNWWKILHKVPPLSPNVEESTLFSEVNLLIRKSAKSKSYTWGKEGWWKGGKRIAVRTSNDDEKGKALRKTGIHPEVMTVNSEARFDINQMSYNPLVLPPIPPPPQMPTVLQPCWLNSSYQSLNKNVSSLPPVEHLWHQSTHLMNDDRDGEREEKMLTPNAFLKIFDLNSRTCSDVSKSGQGQCSAKPRDYTT